MRKNYQLEINNNGNNQSNLGFFKSIYNYLLNFIQGIPSRKNNDIKNKLNESINYYSNHYQNYINLHVKDFSTSKIGLINLLNDCYIVSFLQILFHIPDFLKILKKYSKKGEETIINYIIMISEYPFNVQYFYKLKQLLGLINPDYSKPFPNDSQEFGIDLINYLITDIKNQIPKDKNEIHYLSESKDFVNQKKMILKNYVSIYQKNVNEFEKLFSFNQIDIFYRGENIKPNISTNLHLEFSLNKFVEFIDIESLIQQRYNDDKIIPKDNQIIIKSKIVSLPEILIITINRVLNNENINFTKLIFRDVLDLKNYIDYDLYEENNKKTTYHLFAVNECIHYYELNHYKCYIKLENNWFLFDDDKKVVQCSFDFMNSPFIVGLFYQRDKN